jgi:hypothetical protein
MVWIESMACWGDKYQVSEKENGGEPGYCRFDLTNYGWDRVREWEWGTIGWMKGDGMKEEIVGGYRLARPSESKEQDKKKIDNAQYLPANKRQVA